MFSRIYIHIPYCLKKCGYCAFTSQQAGDRSDLARYVGLLREELRLRTNGEEVDSVYFGGGTPSLLDPDQVAVLMDDIRQFCRLQPDAEITLEANPGTISSERLKGFRQAGVNRLSIGVQSFTDVLLARLGRIHTGDAARRAVADARSARFDSIGIDLIHGLPGQTEEMWGNELASALELRPDHLSVYGLTIEEGTPFAARYGEDSPDLPDDDLSATMFEMADDTLTRNGYEHYEIANYALPGCRSRHNSGYWRRDGYLGIGAGAHSFLRDGFGVRFSNSAELPAYEASLGSGIESLCDLQTLDRQDAMSEFMFLGLRMAAGGERTLFAREFGQEVEEVFARQLDELSGHGLIITDQRGIRLTRHGMLLSNQVFSRFLL